MNNKLLLHIAEPCHESWDKMTPAGEGRFCSSCAKTVTDFTGFSDYQLVQYFEQHKAPGLCGRFHEDQLNKWLESPQIKTNHPKIYKYLLSLAMLASSASIHAQETKREVSVKTEPQTSTLPTAPEAGQIIPQACKPLSDSIAERPRIIMGIMSPPVFPMNDPVFVMDGKVYPTDVMKRLSPTHIRTVNTLKAAQARALFGSEGMNGAIVVTTNFTDKERKKFVKEK